MNGRTPVGREGHRVTIKKGPQRQDIAREEKNMVPDGPDPSMTASVGLSLTKGRATDFGQEKLEVSSWCTLPCRPDDVSMLDAYETCYNHVATQVEHHFDEALARFFPELVNHDPS